ncbi:restriction endonuclease subunit S [Natroniella acetigena]|uniref:restriction endonuclease subunit S n=1 Tax=Natroniella acetigena TaxID=52004 RepID=UPI00200B3B17|nr:restriction endonuclease subunit S [Natroniella acetigena]MCK8827631.1 restriction endonuclease subunit S [Natroniella acetigena]
MAKKSLEKKLEEALVSKEEQPYEVPENWVWVKLKYINKRSGQGIKPKDYPDEKFELYSVPSYAEGKPKYSLGKEIGSRKKIVFEDNVLICRINPRLNRVWIVNSKNKYRQIASTEWIVVNSRKNVYPKYLRCFCMSSYYRRYLRANTSGVGGSLTRARAKDVRESPIALPPLKEQKRIVARVESMLDKIKQARELIEQTEESFEGRKAAILAKAFRGELTEQWREKNENIESAKELIDKIWDKRFKLIKTKSTREQNKLKKYYEKSEKRGELDNPLNIEMPPKWKVCQIVDIGDVHNGATPLRREEEYWGGNINWISSGEVKDNIITDSEEKITQLGYENSSVTLLKPGTVLLAMIGNGKTRGRTAILDIEATTNQNIAGIALEHGLMCSKYLWYWFQFRYEYTRIRGNGSGPKALNGKKVRRLPLVLAPLEEQKEIVKILDSMLGKMEREKEIIEKVKDKLATLEKSILAKAFRGELGTNDPEDGDVLELLKEVLSEE